MGLKDDLEREVADTLQTQWTQRDGYVVPTGESVRLRKLMLLCFMRTFPT